MLHLRLEGVLGVAAVTPLVAALMGPVMLWTGRLSLTWGELLLRLRYAMGLLG